MPLPLREIPLPEIRLQETVRLQELTRRVMNLDLSGFIIRQIGGEPPEPHLAVAAALRPAIEIGNPLAKIPLRTPRPRGDLGTHLDAYVMAPNFQLNLHYTLEGRYSLRLFSVLPEFRDDLFENGVKAFCDPTRFQDGDYDAELVSRDVRVGEGGAGDMVVFSDAMTVHDFHTIGFPRVTWAYIYNVPRLEHPQ